jgi:N-methylhydantoinase A
MGGTTAKAALVEEGRFHRVNSLDVGGGINLSGRLLKGGGYHVSAPAIDIAEVGAGGGSIVRIDAGGSLRIGPDSAGSSPGPACYDQGGTMPTVTDANVMLGFVNPEALAGGNLPIKHALARKVIDEQIAGSLGLNVADAAWGIHRVANATMARALRAVSIERGLDPRQFALIAFGGNGPVHAATLARLLDITRIFVPPIPGLFSSLGMLFPEIEHHYARTYKCPLDESAAQAIEREFESLEMEGRPALLAEGVKEANQRFERLVDVRYAAANSELTLPYCVGGDSVLKLRTAFAEAHERQFGYHSPEETVEIMNLRLIARSASPSGNVPEALALPTQASPLRRSRQVYFGSDIGWVDAPVLARSELPQAWLTGPLLVDEYDSTTVVPPSGRIRRSTWDTMEVELS